MKCNISFSNGISGKLFALKFLCLLAAYGWLMSGMAPDAQATTFGREQDIPDLKLGQRVKIDDGSCPPGQVKEVSGAKMTESGVARARKCVPRVGIKQKTAYEIASGDWSSDVCSSDLAADGMG